MENGNATNGAKHMNAEYRRPPLIRCELVLLIHRYRTHRRLQQLLITISHAYEPAASILAARKY
jgi:hypothetical protein